MADQLLIVQPRIEANTIAAEPLSGGEVTFFRSGTTQLASVYADNDLTVALNNPILADAAGRLPEIFFAGGYEIRAVIRDTDGVLIETLDPCFRFNNGAGRFWQDVTSQRVSGLAYQNTTGRDIDVSIIGYGTAASVEASINGSAWVVVGYTSGTTDKGGPSFTVPSGSYYRVNGSPTISSWSENR